MSESRPDWMALNAYVDGELTPDAAARVARAAGADPDIASQISVLYRLKGGLKDALPSAPPDLVALLPAPLPRRGWRGLLVAGALAGSLAAVAVGIGFRGQAPAVDLFATVRTTHADWIRADGGGALAPTPAVLDALAQFGRLPLLPDLAAAGLDLARVETLDTASGNLLHVAYRGHHGCHLSLFVVAGPGLAAPPQAAGAAMERRYAWGVADLSYLLYAQGMDPARFDFIAAKVEQATRAFAPLNPLDREQLASNTRESAHCQV